LITTPVGVVHAGGEIADGNGEGDGVPAGGEHMHGAMEDPADVNIIDAHSEGQGTAMSEDSAAARSSSQQSAEAPSDSSEEEEGMWAGSEGNTPILTRCWKSCRKRVSRRGLTQVIQDIEVQTSAPH